MSKKYDDLYKALYTIGLHSKIPHNEWHPAYRKAREGQLNELSMFELYIVWEGVEWYQECMGKRMPSIQFVGRRAKAMWMKRVREQQKERNELGCD